MSLQITAPNRYGALQEGFSLVIEDGYHVLVGANDSGKSSILQLAFSAAMNDPGYGAERSVLLLPERSYVQPTTETGGRTLAQYNGDLLSQGSLNTSILAYDSVRGPQQSELPRLLLNHTSFMEQVQRLNEFLPKLGFPELVLRASQMANFDDVAVQFHGTGLRSLLGLLGALSDREMRMILIDEPELSLEPKLQKRLRDVLVDESDGRVILVATHSHLFLNRRDPVFNHVVQSESGVVSVSPVGSEEGLYDLVFSLLGNDTSDLFFPGNYVVVEGASDQYLVERALSLLDVPHGHVKVLAAGGTSRVSRMIQAVLDSLIERPRESWRLQTLRGWSHATTWEVSSRDPGACGADGAREPGCLRLAVGSDHLDRQQARANA